MNKLNASKYKSNPEVLCLKCWKIMSRNRNTNHLIQKPGHKAYLLTASQYASEQQICQLAKANNKFIKKTDSEHYIISPFVPANLDSLNTSMIKRGSAQWNKLIDKLIALCNNSNPDVLCVKCWQVLNSYTKNEH